jgi:transketolase
MEGADSFGPTSIATKMWAAQPYGRTLHFGVREHAMGSILNGIALHGPTRPYGGTFLIFSDYMRPAVRLAALMKSSVIYVWTHDSIGLGEDGPTHQPIEHLAALRAIPGLAVLRPGDANETAHAWRATLERPEGPKGIALTRQDLPILAGTSAEGVAKGGYVLADASSGDPQVILIGTGSEVQLCLTARERLEADGTPTRVVSMPCQEWFAEQDQSYRESVIPRGVRARVSVEAGIAMSWRHILGDCGEAVSIEHYGASAPYQVVFEQFGFTPDHVVAAAHASLARVGDITGSTTGN